MKIEESKKLETRGPADQTKITFRPLYGTYSEDPLSYLLQINDCRILLDCGWNDAHDEALLAPLIEVLGEIDAVLISHPDSCHVGALPYLVSRLKLQAPVFGTVPLQKMGGLFLKDELEALKGVSDFDLFTAADVDYAFGRMHTLKHKQYHRLQGRGEGITICPEGAGHMVGGSMWRITTPEQEEIVYAVDCNHKQERHLNSSVLDRVVSRPAVLICDAVNGMYSEPARKERDRLFFDAIIRTLRNNGNVLIPTDTAGRVLELIIQLEKHWLDYKRQVYPLVLLSSVAPNLLSFAQSQLEWMNDSITKQFEKDRDNAFKMRYLKAVRSREELSRLPHGPKVVLASLPSLEAGPARQLAYEWAADPKNLIILTERPKAGTLAARLLAAAPRKEALRMTLARRVPLEGRELAEFLDAKRAALMEPEEPPEETPVQPAEKPLRSSSDAIGLLDRVVSAAAETLPETPDPKAVAEMMLEPEAGVLYDGFTVPTGSSGPMFPFEDDGDREWDAYGESLAPTDIPALTLADKAADVVMTAAVEEEEEVEPEEQPSKVVRAEATVVARAGVLLVDFEGRSDGRSLRLVINSVAPRHLIIVHGTRQSTEIMRAECAAELRAVRTRVHAPAVGEIADVSPGSSSYSVALSEELLSGVSWRPLGEYQLGWVDAVVGPPPEDGGMSVLLPSMTGGGGSGGGGGEGGVFIGDVKLSELKAALDGAGITSHFEAGALVCPSGPITVYKPSGGEGELVVEGVLGEEYYKAQALVYSLFHVC